ncbi:unnamed protein product [Adineta ricciae]|uniref:Uncharacterized protein n=1 Tax=Adineta ricciae TaxID=249248 RepID=A0A814BG29_ADIRI|nr:unnamed protein product [Adineta ricciae]
MATSNDLDDFFKKKDRKVNKHKKPTGLLTNNEELLKQLVIVTSATSAFKENMDFDEEDDEEFATNNHHRQQFVGEPNGIVDTNEVAYPVVNKTHSHLTSTNSKTKNTAKLSVQDNNNLNEKETGVGQQDEWEEFEESNSKYHQLRLKISRGTNEQNNGEDDEDNDDYYDDGRNHDENTDENLLGPGGEPLSRNNRRREQQNNKPVWKLNEVKADESAPATNDTTDSPSEKTEEPVAPAKPVSTAYRAPALRNNSSIAVVGNTIQRASKKEKPNLASTEEFPTLGAAVNKK